MIITCDRARRRARWLRYAILTTICFIVAANVFLAWRSLTGHPNVLSIVQLEVTDQLVGHPRLALIANALVSLVYLYGLYRLVKLMRLFERGDFFCTQATSHLQAFSLSLLFATMAGCLLPAVELAASRAIGLNHVQAASIQMDISDVWMILISTLFFLIAWIMGEARQLAEDNQLII
jgi:hypothetical protein